MARNDGRGGIRILTDSPLTTVQDAGRHGFQRYGVPVSGAMDPRSHALAALLVGNGPEDAGLEITLLGPEIEFTAENTVAVTGADLGARIDGLPMPTYKAVRVRRGEVLSFAGRRSGCRCYVAFAGGLDIPAVMGSRSTHVPSGMGGYEGRRLQRGDEIGFLAPGPELPAYPSRAMVPEDFSGDTAVLRAVRGPQDDRFADVALKAFFSEAYAVTSQSDRMGSRLSGAPLKHVTDANILSDGVSFGAVQVPDSGQPIVMLADRQTIGGYAKIANVIRADLSQIAQRVPGDTVRFAEISVDAAQKLYLDFLREMRRIEGYFQ